VSRRVLLKEFTDRKREEGSTEVETEDGQVFVVPPPLFWPGNFAEIARTGDVADQAAAMLGSQERLDEFVAAGGSPSVLVAIVSESLQATPGE
jgi:hypothetical protein